VHEFEEGGVLLLERQELLVRAFPVVDVALEAVVGGVHADQHAGLLDHLPERVELGQGERAPLAVRAGDGSGPDEDRAGAALDHVLELTDRRVDDRQRDDRRREDPVLVVVRPVLEHPLIQRVHDGMGGLRGVGEPLLDQAGQGRLLDGDARRRLARTGARLVTARPAVQLNWDEGEPDEEVLVVGDLDGSLKRWFDGHAESVVLLRPDRIVGGASPAYAASAMVRSFDAVLGAPDSADSNSAAESLFRPQSPPLVLDKESR
jgi:hypothetical protein